MSFDEVFSGTMTEVKEFLTSDKIDRSMILNRVFDDRRQQLIYLVGVTHKKTKEEKLEEYVQGSWRGESALHTYSHMEDSTDYAFDSARALTTAIAYLH